VRNTRHGGAFGAVGFSLFSAVALAAALFQLYALAESRRAESWLSVQGSVVESRVEAGCLFGAGHSAALRYRYALAGTSYEGRRIEFGRDCGSEAAAREMASRFPVGMTVRVRVNPADPGDAALIAQVSERTKTLLAVLSALYLLGGALAWRSFARRREARAAGMSDDALTPPSSPPT
jgi:hypothetical protein